MTKQITIKDIANDLGIHHTTVSRALRNHPDVKEETRKLILNKAKKMHYVPNTFATGLRNNQSKTIGIMVPDIRPNFFSSTISHITNIAHQEGFSVMIFQSNEDENMEEQNINALVQHRVAGLIVSVSGGTLDSSNFNNLKEMNIPVVYFDRIPEDNSLDKVQIDNIQAGYDATEYLIDKGYKDIAFYTGYNKVSVISNRLIGYKKVMKERNMIIRNKNIFQGGLSFEDGYLAANNIVKLNNIPDAIICAVDQVAFGMIKAFNQKDIKIPSQVALMGFDNDPSGEMIQPSLTTMAQPIEAIAKNTFAFLLQRINDKNKIKFPIQTKLIMNLIKRESTI